MESILDALQIVLSIFAMIAVGMLLTQLKWIGEKEASFLSRFVIRVALPATIVTNMFGKFTAESLVGMAAGLIAPVIGLLLGMAIGYLVAKLLKIERRRFGAFVVLFTFSNSIFIGLPVCRALFGEDAYRLYPHAHDSQPQFSLGKGLSGHLSGQVPAGARGEHRADQPS